MSEGDYDSVIICQRVADLAEPIAGSLRRACASCQAPVWVDASFIAKLAAEHPGTRIGLRCEYCVPADHAPPTLHLSNIAAMREHGVPDDEIARVCALVLAADATTRAGVRAAQDEIRADPTGPRGVRYAHALVEALEFLAGMP